MYMCSMLLSLSCGLLAWPGGFTTDIEHKWSAGYAGRMIQAAVLTQFALQVPLTCVFFRLAIS